MKSLISDLTQHEHEKMQHQSSSPTQPPEEYKVQSWPNALETIQSSTHIQKTLLQDCTSAATARCQLTQGDYSHGTTFWVGALDKPKTTLESLALQIFQEHVIVQQERQQERQRRSHSTTTTTTMTRCIEDGDGGDNDDDDIVVKIDKNNSGAEWWTLAMDGEDGGVGWHWDKDYHAELQEGKNIHPYLATVTYLTNIGAPTMIIPKTTASSKVLSDDYILSDASSTSNNISNNLITCAYLSRPILGKHIAFDGRLLHSAPIEIYDELKSHNPKISSIGQETTTSGGNNNKTKRGRRGRPRLKRATFLVNIWINHKPFDAIPIDISLQAKLSKLKIKIGDLKQQNVVPPLGISVIAIPSSSSSSSSIGCQQQQSGGGRQGKKFKKPTKNNNNYYKKTRKKPDDENGGDGGGGGGQKVSCNTTISFDWKLNDNYKLQASIPIDAIAEAWNLNDTFKIQWEKGTIRPYIEEENNNS